MKEGIDYVGVGAWGIITKGSKILLLQRNNKDHWERPGGKHIIGEDLKETFAREAFEETGIKIKNLKFNDYHQYFDEKQGNHWISIGFSSEYESGEAENLEPNKHKDVQWFDIDNLPENLSKFSKAAMEKYKSNLF